MSASTQHRRRIEDILEDAAFMFAHGTPPDVAAARLGISVNTLQTYYRRAGLDWPWVYDPSVREYLRRIETRRDRHV